MLNLFSLAKWTASAFLKHTKVETLTFKEKWAELCLWCRDEIVGYDVTAIASTDTSI